MERLQESYPIGVSSLERKVRGATFPSLAAVPGNAEEVTQPPLNLASATGPAEQPAAGPASAAAPEVPAAPPVNPDPMQPVNFPSGPSEPKNHGFGAFPEKTARQEGGIPRSVLLPGPFFSV